MPLEVDFWSVFGGFWEAKWSQVGTKMAFQIDLILKAPKIKKTFKNQRNFNDFVGSGGRSWHPKSSKNRSKFEAQVEVPLGIDF